MFNLILFLIILSFNLGLLENLFGLLPEVSGYIIDISILIVSVLVLLNGKSKYLKTLWIIPLFIIISLISKFFNSSEFILFVVGIRRYLMPIFMLFIGLNIYISDNNFHRLTKTIIFLFSVQFFVAIYKLYTVGMQEHMYIGTLANFGGAISTILPLLGINLFLVLYLDSKKKVFILLMISMLFFGYVGLKRALVFLAPINIFLSIVFYYWLMHDSKLYKIFNPKVIISVGLLAMVIIYLGVRIMPTLNPENKVWGSFDLAYTIDYAAGYEDRKDYGKLDGSGRLNAYEGIFYFLTSNTNAFHKLIVGIGPGTTERNSFTKFDQFSMEALGLGYASGLVGGAKTVLQFGLLGLIVYTLFLFKLFSLLVKFALNFNVFQKKWLIITILWLLIMTVDFLFYSHLILIVRGMYLPLYLLIGYYVRKSLDSNFKHENIIY
ncbi:MAG: hypothetical protein KF721_09550 [Ignavibacteriaceae bacterium]|nr:hypothetical protein [Ignavibacteriaceae bacterium]